MMRRPTFNESLRRQHTKTRHVQWGPSWPVFLAIAMLGFGGAPCPGPPVEITRISVDEITHQRAVVTVETEDASYLSLNVYPLPVCASRFLSDESPEATRVHSVPLDALAPGTEYRVRAEFDTGGGRDVVFTTLASPFGEEGQYVHVPVEVTAVSSARSGAFGQPEEHGQYALVAAARAVDGCIATQWVTATDGDNAFIVVDPGPTATITHVRFRGRQEPDESGAITAFQLSTTTVTGEFGPFETPDPTLEYQFELPNLPSGSPIMIRAVSTTGGNTGAREISLLELLP